MATKKSPTLAFTRQYLRRDPNASFAEIRDAAAEQDLKIYPIVFGRAKALEGLVKVAPYGSKKRAREAAKAESLRAAAALQSDGLATRERHAVASSDSDSSLSLSSSIENMIAGMRENHADRERFRSALIKISEILDEVL